MFELAKSNLSLGGRSQDKTNALCSGLVAQNVVLCTSCLLGIIGNLILIAFIFKHRRGRLTPDKLLITNFAIVDLIACVTSLPLHLVAINGNSGLSDNAVCVARFYFMFTCFAVNIMTLAAISIDRYDAVCRAPLREITCRKTAYFLIFIWPFAISTTAVGGLGHVLTSVRGEHVCLVPGRGIAPPALIGRYIMLCVVTLWILPSLYVVFTRFYGIVKHVRDHLLHLRTVLGTSGVNREVAMTKTSVAMVATYLGLWVPFAIMIILRNRFSSTAVHCTYLWTYSLAFSSFTVVPIEYMLLDKRFLTLAKKKCFRCKKVAVKREDAIELQSTENGMIRDNPTLQEK